MPIWATKHDPVAKRKQTKKILSKWNNTKLNSTQGRDIVQDR